MWFGCVFLKEKSCGGRGEGSNRVKAAAADV